MAPSKPVAGPKSAAQQALEAALRLLALRARSRHELRTAMTRRGFGAPEQDAALRRLAELGYVDDQRFARGRAVHLLRDGKLGPRAVLQRLVAHGLSEVEAREAIAFAEAETGFDALAAARSLLDRRGLGGPASCLDARQRQKAFRLLGARGFPDPVVEALLGDAALDSSGQDE